MKMQLWDYLSQYAENNPEGQAVVDSNGEYTYGELDIMSNKVAYWLLSLGVNSGDRVLIWGTNSIEIVAAIFGVLKAGAVFVPIHPDISSLKLFYLCNDCQPSAVIMDPTLLEGHQELFANIPTLLMEKYEQSFSVLQVSGWHDIDAFPGLSVSKKISPNDLAAIIYTSGSTKNPKGVMSLHKNMIFAATAINSVLKNTASDVVLCGLPLSFDYGLYQVFLCTQVGAKLILVPNFGQPLSIPKLLKSHKITGLPGVPSLFALLLRSRLLERVELPDLRYLTSTGDVFPPTHIDRLRELLPHVSIYSMYGLTECKRVSILTPDEVDKYRGSVGKPIPGTEVAVISDDGTECKHGVGELVVRGPHVMAGYWRDSVETAKRYVYDPKSGSITLHTSDRFRIDDAGYLYFVGRDEMIIKRRGLRVSVAEIENFLCSLHGIQEAAVVGLPDPIQGEKIIAFISVDRSVDIDLSNIRSHCEKSLSMEAWPEEINLFTTPLLKTPNGKIDRTGLRRTLLNSAVKQPIIYRDETGEHAE